MDYYSRVVDELLANNITPYITLFHWDTPAALQGGWQIARHVESLCRYAAYVTKHLGDRVKHWMTTNEFVCFTDLGYKIGQFAPGLKLAAAQVNQVRHHGILAHGLAVQAIRANTPSGTQVGLAENATVYVPDHGDAGAHRGCAEGDAAGQCAVPHRADGRQVHGCLPGARGRQCSQGRARRLEGDLAARSISSASTSTRRSLCAPTTRSRATPIVPYPTSQPHMASPWILLAPECIYWGVRNVVDLWKIRRIFITENGCSSDDVLTPAGRIDDIDRLMYLRNHITHLHRAVTEGYPVKGYFLWSLLDNFEWADGYSKRFGIHYVDFKTQKRTPKLSAEWYREVISHNAVF